MRRTRRSFLATSAALPFALKAMAEPTNTNPRWVLMGTDKGEGIYRAAWNAATGELGTTELAIATEHPTYLALHPRLPVLYAANEANHGDGALSSFNLDTTSAALTPVNQVSARGNGTCYVSVDHRGRRAFGANYGGGSMASFALGKDGSLLETDSTLFNCNGNPACGALGPNKVRQDAPHLHCATVSPDNNFLLVCNLGEDAIEVFPLQADQNEKPGTPTRIATRAGSGPRHVAFHPNGRWLYCIHELDCTIALFVWSVTNARPTLTPRPGSIVSTKAASTPLAGCTACEIVISDDGRFAYANTRGENSLVVFRIDSKTGLLTEQQRVPSGGTVTRYFTLDPSRHWLLCAHQGSSAITVFAHDPATGRLSDTPQTFPANTPMFLQFV